MKTTKEEQATIDELNAAFAAGPVKHRGRVEMRKQTPEEEARTRELLEQMKGSKKP